MLTKQGKEKRILNLKNQGGPKIKKGQAEVSPATEFHEMGFSKDALEEDLESLNIPQVSRTKLSKVRIISRLASDEQKESLKAGKTTVNKVYEHLRKKNLLKSTDESKASNESPTPEITLKVLNTKLSVCTGGKRQFVLVACEDADEQTSILEKLSKDNYQEFNHLYHYGNTIIVVTKQEG